MASESTRTQYNLSSNHVEISVAGIHYSKDLPKGDQLRQLMGNMSALNSLNQLLYPAYPADQRSGGPSSDQIPVLNDIPLMVSV